MIRRGQRFALIAALLAAAGVIGAARNASAATPDLQAFTPAGWGAPSGPDKALFGFPAFPTQLDGDLPNTYIHYAYQNIGVAAASGFPVRELLDGSIRHDWSPPGSLLTGQSAAWLSAPFTVRGGRHTVGFQPDYNNILGELDLANNNHASQWVWSPTQTTLGGTLFRPAPPDPNGGRADVSGTSWPNVDGLRTPNFSPLVSDGFWCATAMLPAAMAADLDLNWYAPSTGPDNGFKTPLATSAQSFGHIEILIKSLDADATFDIGVEAYDGNSAYQVQSVGSLWAGSDPVYIPPVTMGPGQLIRLFEIYRSTPEQLQVLLENISGNADLGFALYEYDATSGAPQTYYAQNLGIADAVGDGLPEQIVVNENLEGRFIGILVWRTSATDLNKTVTFALRLGTPGNVGVDGLGAPRAALRLAPVQPNPVRDDTQLGFDLPAARNVTLTVYDLHGHRVTTLASGRYEAGTHRLTWAGTDERGGRVGNGMYFVQMDSEGFQQTQRVTLIR